MVSHCFVELEFYGIYRLIKLLAYSQLFVIYFSLAESTFHFLRLFASGVVKFI